MSRTERLTVLGALAIPWLFIWQGLDFTDQGYLVTGYRCFFRYPEATEDSSHMWLTNLIGATWDALFGGLGLIGMRALWALCLSVGMWLAFRLTRALTSERAAALAVLVTSAFLSNRRETWFSYNTSSSLLFAAAAFVLWCGIMRRRPSSLFAAGALLGVAPFARFPNVLGWALLAAPAFAAVLAPERRAGLIRDIGVAALGVAAGVSGTLALIYLRGDADLYFGGLRSLFAPSMQEAGYSTHSLLHQFIRGEKRALGLGLAVCAGGFALSRTLARLSPRTGALVVVASCGFGVLGLTYTDEPWRWVVPGTTYFVLTAIAAGVWHRSFELRLAAFILLIVVFIAPLGSNNGIKNAHMGLWLALPLVLAALGTLEARWLAGQGAKLALIAGVVLSGEAIHWAATYTYRDQRRSKLTHAVGSSQLAGQYTSAARAQSVREVLGALRKRVSPGDYLLAYEGAPLLQYLTETRPYLNRPWLMGWVRGDVVARLAAQAPHRTDCLPVAVSTFGSTRSNTWPEHLRPLEQDEARSSTRAAINAFLKEHHYEPTWHNDFFEILEPSGRHTECR